MSNSERQRKFRAGHPGYFRKYKAWRRPAAAEQAARTIAALLSAPAATPPPPASQAAPLPAAEAPHRRAA